MLDTSGELFIIVRILDRGRVHPAFSSLSAISTGNEIQCGIIMVKSKKRGISSLFYSHLNTITL